MVLAIVTFFMTKIESGIVQPDIFKSENISGIFWRIVENVISPSGFAQTDAFKAFGKNTAAVAVGIKLCNDFVAFSMYLVKMRCG